MKVIDAHTGMQVRVGSRVPLPVSVTVAKGARGAPSYIPGPADSLRRMKRTGNHYYEVLEIRPGIFSASMVARFVEGGRARVEVVPLRVRWTHPGFPFQHVAFVPS